MSLKVSRTAHREGHTSLSYDDIGKHIATCGSDGNLRIWEAPDYDIMTTHPIGDKAFAIHIRNNHIYVSNDNNGIPAMAFPFLEPEGYLSFFSAPVTYIVSNKTGTIVCAGSCDFTLRVIHVKDRTYKELKHEAPVLSIDLDPKEEFLLSSSCDGSVCVWNLSTNVSAKSWKGIIPKSNSFENSKVLCRIAWEPSTGSFLAIPTGKTISIYQRNSWELLYILEDSRIDSDLSVCTISPNGSYLLAGSATGFIIVWNISSRQCIEFVKNDKRIAITGISWNPKKKEEFSYCDYDGQLHVYHISSINNEENFVTEDDVLAALNEPFEDDSDNENSFSISRIKAETVGLSDDENTSDVKPPTKYKQTQPRANGIDDDDMDAISLVSETFPRESSNWNLKSNFQSSFQPGSTPVHLSHRFMIWNSIGIITSHNADDEVSAIEIEFHDSAVHHAIHITNNSNYTMAAISTEAAIFANETQEDSPSELLCMHFGSWDSCKEWTVNMPDKEEIQAIAIGKGWVAAASNQRQLRMFTVGGIQLEPISLPGPVVCMNGLGDQLIVSYHLGAGFPGDQNLAVIVLSVLIRKILHFNVPVSLSPQSTLMWLGFTDEGTPTTVDSNGIVNLMRTNVGDVWVQICNTRADIKGKSDHFFVTALSEVQESIWCIPCKGAKYPPTLPRPVMTVIPIKLPLCEMNTEKGQLEESIWRKKLLHETVTNLGNDQDNNFNIDEITRTLQASLMKAFALACRSDREFRGMEICELMPSSYSVQLAIKYATSQKHLQLAQRLSSVAYQKQEEEEMRALQVSNGNVPDVEVMEMPEITKTKSNVNTSARKENKLSEDELSDELLSEDDIAEDEIVQDDVIEVETPIKNKTAIASTNGKKNPFKKNLASPRKSIESAKGTDIFDKLKNNKKEKNSQAKKSLIFPTKPNQKRQSISGTNVTFKSWFTAHKDDLQTENPHLDEKDLKKFASDVYKKISEQAKKQLDENVKTGVRKRKLTEDESPSMASNKNKKQNVGIKGKLTNFMFTRGEK